MAGMVRQRTPTAAIELPQMDIRELRFRLIGDSPLISHRWSEKAREQMLAKQMKKAKLGKEAKDPERDYKESLYVHPDGGYGFPAVAFKSAAITACSQVDGLTKVLSRSAFHIPGELVKIEGEPRMREDMVRVGMGTADIRYRGEFPDWSCEIQLRYNATALSAEQILNLFRIAGFGVGVGEWRPERNGSYGMFHVEGESED